MKQKTDQPRQCYFIPAMQDNPHGFIPSLVTEHEAGHSPMTGGPDQEPWYWGKTLKHAEQTCDRVNLKRFGISRNTMHRIVGSSMGAGRVTQ